MSRAPVGLIWAQSQGGVIGAGGSMPWHVPEDLAHFKAVTVGATVIMGRKTWDSLPPRFRPLPGRRNIVVTRNVDWAAPGAEPAASVDQALDLAGDGARVWVIGGAQIFAEALDRADLAEITIIADRFDGDTFAPRLDGGWVAEAMAYDPAWLTSSTGVGYRFARFTRSAATVPGGAPQ